MSTIPFYEAAAMQIVNYAPLYAEAFARLNREWIEKFFVMEPIDEQMLADPEGIYLSGGGAIFILLDEQGIAVGCCAMKPEKIEGVKAYELSKMAVTESFQGRGAGKKLLEHAIQWAKEQGADKVTLVTNSRQKAAIAMYEKTGFITTFRGQHPLYARGDWAMELPLQQSVVAKAG
jgi:GNAT superfamily N-acetyltransferase